MCGSVKHFKILITGSHGAGKTTLIRTLSDCAPVATEALDASDASGRSRTTIGLDYGEVALGGGRHVHLYGTPGHLRFKFMRTILAVGAQGAIVLVDGRAERLQAELESAIASVDDLAARSALVVGVTHLGSHLHRDSSAALAPLAAFLSTRSLNLPMLSIDPRRREHAALLLELLLHAIGPARDDDPAPRIDPARDSRLFA
jgi:uncharacterized protein